MILIIAFNDSGRYTALAAAKSADGRENPEILTAHNRACGFFVRVARRHLSMVGRAGQPKGWPGSVGTGFSPLYVSPPMTVRSLGGELLKLPTEVATMATIPTLAQPEITIVNGLAVTTSIAVAEYFQKPHKDVLAKLSRLECSPEFTERNFSLSSYIDSTGRKLPCYQITRDGFAFLAMAFTGKRAAQFKEAYITAF
ncbi:peptidase, partial [Kosakonia cowanii]